MSIKHLCWLFNQLATDNMATDPEASQHPRTSLQAQLRPSEEDSNPGGPAGEQTLSSLTYDKLGSVPWFSASKHGFPK